MNAREITLKTIKDNKFITGNIIKGKGIEIFAEDPIEVGVYGDVRETDLIRLSNLLNDADLENLYISSYYQNGKSFSDIKFESQPFTLAEFIQNVKDEPLQYKYINIKRKTKALGYISLSKYKSTRESQTQLCSDLLELCGLTVYASYEDSYDLRDSDSAMYFCNSHDGKYYQDDYILEHGSNFCETTSDCSYFDGRMTHYNESIMDFYKFDESEYLKEIDPDERISVYHRKGKDWYIGYSLNEEDMCISFKEEDYKYEKDDCEEDMVYFHSVYEDKELLEKVLDAIKSEKDGLEMESFIANELKEDYGYHSCGVNFKVVELLYDETRDLRDEIQETIDYDYKNIKENFIKAYNAAIDSKMTIRENLKVEINYSSFLEGAKISVYNHLAILKRLENRFNYKLVKSSVSESIKAKAWAIKQGNEEYHFSIAEVIANDISSSESIKEFIINALDALNMRKIEKLEEKELYEKASHVFVGLDDSLSSGNCEFGTKQFTVKYNININDVGGIRGDVLLDLEKTPFTLRAVSYAISNHR